MRCRHQSDMSHRELQGLDGAGGVSAPSALGAPPCVRSTRRTLRIWQTYFPATPWSQVASSL
jgi:hypothetical protein